MKWSFCYLFRLNFFHEFITDIWCNLLGTVMTEITWLWSMNTWLMETWRSTCQVNNFTQDSGLLEFISSHSLKHSKPITGKRGGNVLTWENRMQIAVEAAQGEPISDLFSLFFFLIRGKKVLILDVLFVMSKSKIDRNKTICYRIRESSQWMSASYGP